MIRAAELRAVIMEQNQYKIAVMTFRDKYLGLPDDLKMRLNSGVLLPELAVTRHVQRLRVQVQRRVMVTATFL